MRQPEFTWPLKLNKVAICFSLLLATLFYMNLAASEDTASKNGWLQQLTADSETEACVDQTNDTPLPFSLNFASIEITTKVINSYPNIQVDHIACSSPPVRAPPVLS